MDEWNILRHGDATAAISALAFKYKASETNPSQVITVGAMHLWLRDWEAAFGLFTRFMKNYAWTCDFAFKFAGTAIWCSNRPKDAIDEWKRGLFCDYADTAGGVTVPMFLFFAAARFPQLLDLSDVCELLRSRTESPIGMQWPGPLASYLLGDSDIEELTLRGEQSHAHLYDHELRIAQELLSYDISFWGGVRALSEGDEAGFNVAMRRVGAIDWKDYDSDDQLFLERLRDPTLFLARREMEIAAL